MADENAEWIDVSGDGGILKKILAEGTGAFPAKGEEAKVHYVGTLTDGGKKFDSSRDRNDYFKFKLGAGQVIKGWDQGVATMKFGEKCILRCREDYAYGKNGSPPSIPGGATLDFEVELFVDFNDVEGVPQLQARTLAAAEDQYQPIKDEAKVTFGFSICDAEGEAKSMAMGGVKFELNDEDTFQQWPEWFHKCVGKMKGKEGKLFQCGDASSLEIPESWGVLSGEFYFRVDIEEFENPKDAYMLDTDENVAASTQRKEKGNACFKAGKYERALKQYKKGADDMEYEVERKKKPADLKEAFDENFHSLFVTLYANMAMAYLKIKDLDKGIEAATKALQYEPQHLKALCRRAQCFAQSERYDSALEDCESALAIDKKNSTAKQVQKFAQGKINLQKNRMKKMARNMFKKRKAPKKKDEEVDKKEEEEEVQSKDDGSKGVSAPYEPPKDVSPVDTDVVMTEDDGESAI